MQFTDQQILARCPLFAELPADDLDALAATAQRRHIRSGEGLFLAGEEARGLMIVVTGKVRIFVISPASGRELVLSVEHPYQAVAELVALDGGVYPASADAAADTELLVLDQTGLQQVLLDRPAVSLHLMRMLGRRLRRLVGLVEAISFQEVIHRLAAHLLQRAQAGLPYALDTNVAIAAELGTVPELVSRNLSRLQAGELVTMQGRTVLTIDRELLKAMAESAGR